MDLKSYIRDINDFPVPGILFRDITPLLMDPEAFTYAVDAFADRYAQSNIDAIIAIEARGFLIGAPLAYRLEKPLALAQKRRESCPPKSARSEYSLEYGSNVMEVHTDSIKAGDHVLIIDDVLATGGTLAAAIDLVEKAGATVEGLALLIELAGLKGRDRLKGYEIFTLVQY